MPGRLAPCNCCFYVLGNLESGLLGGGPGFGMCTNTDKILVLSCFALSEKDLTPAIFAFAMFLLQHEVCEWFLWPCSSWQSAEIF